MPKVLTYTKLDIKGKLIQNIVKMICYWVETTVAKLINEDIYNKQEESRSLIKSIIQSTEDLDPDYRRETLKKNGLHDHLVSRPFPLVIVVVVVMKLIPGHQFVDVQLA